MLNSKKLGAIFYQASSATILDFKTAAEHVVEKMAPIIFEISTPKLISQANKINFGTKF